ncbi:Uncharacterised protein [Bordetella pertussis]|nr:Uncharacterised protein [Bordetella pertussis]
MRHQPRLLPGMRERLERLLVVARAQHREGLAAGVEGMQVQQHVVRLQQRAQGIADTVLVIGRRRAYAQVAIEIAVALALAFAVGQGIGHRQQRQLAARDRQRAAFELGQDAFDGARATDFIAVHRAQHQQPGPRLHTQELVRAQVIGENGRGGIQDAASGNDEWAARPAGRGPSRPS